ncbi:hypothetical protein BGP75_22405 [Motiliproteus sp. MSK22-1]|nr:hypothetical protein BGP75_22405 [Motiliproteus sp. MSK22-1]
MLLACARTETYGTQECQKFRAKIFNAHPFLASSFASVYERIAKTKGYVDANHNLRSLHERLRIRDLNLSWESDDIKGFARAQALRCQKIVSRHQYSDTSYQLCTEIVKRYLLTPPTFKEHGNLISPCIKRMECSRWWRKKLFTKQRRTIEAVARDIGLVSQHSSTYSSMISQSVRKQQKHRNELYLSNTFVRNDEGQEYSLKELSDLSVSNPAIRRGELMTRIKGFELVAQQLGHVGEFYTLTAPSRMHARFKRNGKPNPKYDGTNPLEAHKHLNQLFQCIRSKLHRDDIYVYGLRVVEPNHDGTPHWHLMLFMPEASREKVREVFNSYALKSDGDERGAAKHRFKAVAIDPQKGSAAGYIAKYIAKNIDGAFIGDDLNGNSGREAATAIDAWASTWGIRQFQAIGGPSVTVWRELRRLASPYKELIKTASINDGDSKMSQAMIAANAAEWAAYVMVMGGPILRKCDRPIHPMYSEFELVNIETGELLEENVGLYGDPKEKRVIGLESEGDQIITRNRKWTLTTSGAIDRQGKAGVARANYGASGEQAEPSRPERVNPVSAQLTRYDTPWTRVNNCTHVETKVLMR